jgi:membrane-bound inhibitor of C-type lysozyme
VDARLMPPLVLVLLLGLADCTDRKSESHLPAAPSAGQVNPDAGVTDYSCQDGQAIVAGYPDRNTAVVTYKGHAYTLKLAGTEEGARYTGYGLQWTVRGRQAALAVVKPGEERASGPGLACVAAQAGPATAAATKTSFIPARRQGS